ncbi:MAG: hypothetical protein K2Z80_01655 [Xanthobacteraceae bacterium]|nr:hypothetical protein [Xanthobacteraceae bacterium]
MLGPPERQAGTKRGHPQARIDRPQLRDELTCSIPLAQHRPTRGGNAHRRQVARLPAQRLLRAIQRFPIPAAETALRARLPLFVPSAEFADAGALMACSADIGAVYRQAATFVDKIIKGRKPAELPVELATKFVLVVNLKTAHALGLTLPPALLLRADRVIE